MCLFWLTIKRPPDSFSTIMIGSAGLLNTALDSQKGAARSRAQHNGGSRAIKGRLIAVDQAAGCAHALAVKVPVAV